MGMTFELAPAGSIGATENDIVFKQFNRSELNPRVLSLERLNGWVTALSPNATEANQSEVNAINAAYRGRNRFFHNGWHQFFMMQESIPEDLKARFSYNNKNIVKNEALIAISGLSQALIALSGAYHDTGYMNVDGKNKDGSVNLHHALPKKLLDETGLIDLIECSHTGGEKYKPNFKITFKENALTDHVTRMVAQIFGKEIPNEKGIMHFEGGNEFVSALAAAKFLEAHNIDLKTILKACTLIEATVPFKPARGDENGKFPDGHMGELAHRLKQTSKNFGIEMDWNEINDTMLLAVHLANRDISGFIESFATSAHNAILLSREERPEITFGKGEGTMPKLFIASDDRISAPNIYWVMRDPDTTLSPENIPHFYYLRDENGKALNGKDEQGRPLPNQDSYPTQKEYETAAKNARRNNELCLEYFKAKRCGTALATALSEIVRKKEGKDKIFIEEFVYSDLWNYKPRENHPKIKSLTEEERMIYDVLLDGRGREDIEHLEVDKSPIAAMLMGLGHREGINKIYAKVEDLAAAVAGTDFDNPEQNFHEQAQDFIKTAYEVVGTEGMKIICDQLADVAEDPSRGYNQDYGVTSPEERAVFLRNFTRLQKFMPKTNQIGPN